jgi:aspartate/tyrosine/aromatic aminotransferase
MVIRANYSSPPIHGARIVERVLADAANLQQWKDELHAVANRIIKMRTALRGKLEELKTPGIFLLNLRHMEPHHRSNRYVFIHWTQ